MLSLTLITARTDAIASLRAGKSTRDWPAIQELLKNCAVLIYTEEDEDDDSGDNYGDVIAGLYDEFDDDEDLVDRQALIDAESLDDTTEQLDALFDELDGVFMEYVARSQLTPDEVDGELLHEVDGPAQDTDPEVLFPNVVILDGHAAMKEYAIDHAGFVVFEQVDPVVSRINMLSDAGGDRLALGIVCNSPMFGKITYVPSYLHLNDSEESVTLDPFDTLDEALLALEVAVPLLHQEAVDEADAEE